jgi:hypothetical protein
MRCPISTLPSKAHALAVGKREDNVINETNNGKEGETLRVNQPRVKDLGSWIGTRWMIHWEIRSGKAGSMIDRITVAPPNGIDGG